MRAVVRHRHSAEQEDRTAARPLPADQHGQRRDASRRAGIPGWAGGAAHAPVRGPARDRAAIAGQCTPGDDGAGGRGAGGRARAVALDLTARSTKRGATGIAGGSSFISATRGSVSAGSARERILIQGTRLASPSANETRVSNL